MVESSASLFLARHITYAPELAISTAIEEDKLITFGIKPHRPDTGYGYIEFNEKLMSIVVMIENTNTKTKGLAKEISNEIINYQIKEYNDK